MTELERFAAVRALFDELASCSGDEQRSRLAAHADRAVAAEVAALLAAAAGPSALDDGLAALRPPIPARLGRYRVTGLLGAGAMGVVYEGVQETPRRRVALKLLAPGPASDARRALFVQEAHAMASVAHPSVPHVYEVFEVDGEPVVAMEHVEGRTLAAAAPDLGPARVATLLAPVARAVGAAHRRGVVHRDLKPSNLLVDADGTPRVIDFGVASSADTPAPPGSGTAGYMSPEQVAGEPVGPPADVHALGVVGQELVGDLDPELAAIWARARAPAAADRYPDGDALAADLEAWLGGRVPAAARRTPAALWRGLRRRAPRVTVALAALAVALAAAGGLWLRDAHLSAARREAAAEQALAALRARGSVVWADAERLSRDPDTAGTPAVAEAWRAVAATGERRREALVRALVNARDEDRAADWAALFDEVLWTGDLTAAAAIAAGPLAADAERRGRVALARGRVGEAAAALGEAAAALRPLLQVVGPHPGEVGVLVDGGAVLADGEQILRLDAAGEVVHRAPLVGQAMGTAADGDAALVFFGTPRGTIWRASADGALRTIWPDGSGVSSMTVLPGVHGPDLYVTQRHPQRDLLVASPIGAAPRSAHPPTDALAAELNAAAVDLDGDGAQELAVIGWPPHRGDLRVLRPTGAGMEVVWRLREPGTSVADLARPGGQRRLVIAQPTRRGGELAVLDAANGIREATLLLPHHVHLLYSLDLDGDGLDDLVAVGRDPQFRLCSSLVRQGPDGALAAPLTVHDLAVQDARPTATGPALVVARGRQAFVAGLGAGAPLSLGGDAPALPPAPLPAPLRDGVVGALADLGLASDTAEALLERAPWLGDRRELAQREALALLAAAAPDRAYEVARALAPSAVGGLRDAVAEVLTRRADLGALLRSGDAAGDVVAALRGATAAWTFDRPLDAAWAVRAPVAVRRRPVEGALDVGWVAGAGALAEVGLTPMASALHVELDLRLDELDWAAGLRVEVIGDDGRWHVDVQRRGGGPRDGHVVAVGCGDTGAEAPLAQVEGQPLTLRLGWVDGRLGCGLGDLSATDDAPAPLAGPLRLLLSARPDADAVGGGGRARVRRLEVWGAAARPLAPSPDGLAEPASLAAGLGDAAAQRWAEGLAGRPDPAGLRALDPVRRALLLRLDPATWAGPTQAAFPDTFGPELAAAWGAALGYGDPAIGPVLRLEALRRLAADEPLAARFAVARAAAQVDDGALAEAEAALARLRDGPEAEAAWRATARLRLLIGDEPGAAAAVAAWLAVARVPERARDEVDSDPSLRALLPDAAEAPR